MSLKKIEIEKFSKEQYEALVSYLKNEIITRAFWATEQLSLYKDLIEAAIDWNYHNRIPSSLLRVADQAGTTDNRLPTVEEEEARDGEDEFIVLKDPFMSRIFLSWLRAIKNRNLHPNNDWFGINRETDPWFKENNLIPFIEKANVAVVNYYTKENKRFKFRQKYAKLIPEFVGHGYTVGVHTWNSVDEYCDVIAPGTRNFGIYPITDNLSNTNMCFRYEVKYTDLLENDEYDSQLIYKYIKPYDYGNADSYYTDSERKELNETTVKRGLVRVHEVKVPSLYLDTGIPGEDPIIAKNCYFVMLLDAHTTEKFKEEKENVNHGMNDFIIAAYREVEEFETGELVACFNDTFPEDFPGKGPLIPFLYDQAHLNQLRQSHVRLVSLISDPPYSEEDLDGIDDEDTDEYEFLPGKKFQNKRIEVLVPGEFVTAINYIIQAKKIISEDAEGAQGLNKPAQGMPLPGKRSATEVSTIYSESSEAIQDVIQQFDDLILQRSMGIRISKTNYQLKEEVRKSVLAADNKEGIEEDAILISRYLQESKLFQRMKNWSGIEVYYDSFFKQHMRDYEEEQELIMEANELKEQIDMMAQQLGQKFSPAAHQDPAAFQQEQQQRNAAMQQRKAMIDQYRAMIKTIRGIEPVPEASDYLFYKMLTADITQSDIDVVAGTAAIKLKEEKDVLDLLLTYAERIPEFRLSVDFKKIQNMIAKMLKKKPSDFLKSPGQLARVEMELKQLEKQIAGQMIQERMAAQMEQQQIEQAEPAQQ